MNESQSASSAPLSDTPAQPRRVPLQLVVVAVAWAVLVAVAGGFLTGMLIFKFKMIGAFGLWGVGALGGFVSRKITRTACPIAAYSLIVASFVALALAEANWYRWTYTMPDPVTGEQRDATLTEALLRTPKFMWQEAPVGLAVGAICAGFGAQSAFIQAARHYRLVAVAEDS